MMQKNHIKKMKKNILQMSMTERFKYLNEQKRKKFNVQSSKNDTEKEVCELCGK